MKMCRQTTLPRSNTRRGQRRRGASQSYDDDDDDEREESRYPPGHYCSSSSSSRRIPHKMEHEEEREEGDGAREETSSEATGRVAAPSDSSLDGLSAMVLSDGGAKRDRAFSLDRTEGGDVDIDYDNHSADGFPEDGVEIGADHPSWDLLNQDSFGFNLHGTLGSLSFDTDGEILIEDHNKKSSCASGTTTALLDGSRVIMGEEAADRSGKSLSSTVTASLDDTNATDVDWLTSIHYGSNNSST